MQNKDQITISNIPEISAVYFALLQCGYDDYCFMGRKDEHNDECRKFIGTAAVPPFFDGIKQSTCKVYPYWPRAAILETATFYLSPDHTKFRKYEAFRERIMSAGNIENQEKDSRLWDWMADFPAAVSEVLEDNAFRAYMKWENSWIDRQNFEYAKDLQRIQSCLDVCISRYRSPVRRIQVVVNPIKSVYSADYHLDGELFVFSSGAFRAESVIHEFLHHVVSPFVLQLADVILKNRRVYPDIDDSYFISGDDAGHLNAFEEYVVRELTSEVLAERYPKDIEEFLMRLTLSGKNSTIEKKEG